MPREFVSPWQGLCRSKMSSLTRLPSAKWMLRKDFKSTFLARSFSKLRCFVFKVKNKRKTKRSPYKKPAWESSDYVGDIRSLYFWAGSYERPNPFLNNLWRTGKKSHCEIKLNSKILGCFPKWLVLSESAKFKHAFTSKSFLLALLLWHSSSY